MKVLSKQFSFIAVLVLSLIAIAPFFHSGFFQVHDNTQVARVFEMAKALKDGMFPVRWIQDLGYGYGYPLFNFYSPFPYYVGAFFVLLGFNALIATKIMFAIPVFCSGICMWIFLRKIVVQWGAILGSIVYLYFPYHAVNTFIRGDIGELYIYTILPVLGYGLYSLWKADKQANSTKSILVPSFSLALIIISHNLSAYMTFLYLFPLCVLFIALSRNKKRAVFRVSAFLFLAFLLSSFYSMPAVFEMKYTNVTSQLGGGARIVDHFVCPNQFWDSAWGFGGSTKGCVDGFSFRLGKMNVLSFVASLILAIYIFIRKRNKGLSGVFYVSVICFVFSIFMQLGISGFVWKLLPQSSFLQYPWRFLNFTGFFMAIIISYLPAYINSIGKKSIGIAVTTFILLITIITNGKLFIPQNYNYDTSQMYVNTQFMNWTISKISDEYLPSHFSIPKSQADIPERKFEIVSGLGLFINTKAKTGFLSTKTAFVSSSIAHANIAYFPGWKLLIDGSNRDYSIMHNGINFIVPSGIHEVQFKFVQTPIEQFSNDLTILGVFMALFAIIIKYTLYERKKAS